MVEQPPKKNFNRTPPTIAAVVIALAVLGVGGYFVAQRQEPPMPEDAEQIITDEGEIPKDVEYKLPMNKIVGGVTHEHADPSLEFPATSATVALMVEPVFSLLPDANYTMFVRGDSIAYEIWIPPNYLQEGLVPVRLDGKVFPPGNYRVEIVEVTADSVKSAVAETVFRIAK
jgi:hypothetical protein